MSYYKKAILNSSITITMPLFNVAFLQIHVLELTEHRKKAEKPKKVLIIETHGLMLLDLVTTHH